MQPIIPEKLLEANFWTNPRNIEQVHYTTTITKLKTLAVVSVSIYSKKMFNIHQFTLYTKTQEIYKVGSLANPQKMEKDQITEIHNHYAKLYREAIYPMEII